MSRPWVLLFAKAPVLGTVKTRLAATVGDRAALEAYRFLAERQMAAIRQSGLPCVLWTTGQEGSSPAASWLTGAAAVHLQPQGDLGRRLSWACAQAFSMGAPGVVLVGTDCPDLDSAHLEDLAAHVSQGRFAMQPADDGGYVALGLPKNCPEVFQGIAWSTSSVGEATVRILRDLGHAPLVLESLPDIDTQTDWDSWRSREPSPSTEEFP